MPLKQEIVPDKLCINCKHILSGDLFEKCGKSESAFVSPVSGYRHCSYSDCYDCRAHRHQCGPEGKWFEQAEPKKKSTWLESVFLPKIKRLFRNQVFLFFFLSVC